MDLVAALPVAASCGCWSVSDWIHTRLERWHKGGGESGKGVGAGVHISVLSAECSGIATQSLCWHTRARTKVAGTLYQQSPCPSGAVRVRVI